MRCVPAIMGDDLPEEGSDPDPESLARRTESLKKKNRETRSQFVFYEVCSLNRDQGQRHKYFPGHKKSLSSYLSAFESKLADVPFFLRNPISLCLTLLAIASCAPAPTSTS